MGFLVALTEFRRILVWVTFSTSFSTFCWTASSGHPFSCISLLCLCLAEHQNMSDIRKGLSIDNTQQPRAQPVDNAAAAPNAPGRLYKANGEFKPDTLTKDASAGQYEFWKRQFKRYYITSNMDLAPDRGGDKALFKFSLRTFKNRSLKGFVLGLLLQISLLDCRFSGFGAHAPLSTWGETEHSEDFFHR